MAKSAHPFTPATLPNPVTDSQWLAAIITSSEDAIVSKDLNSIVRTWNAGAQRLFGYEAEEIIGRPVTILIPAGRKDEENGILKRIRRGERIDHYETVRQRKDGSLVDVSLTVSPINDANGLVIGASKIARDISDRKRAEQAARQSEERFQLLASHAPVGIFLSDHAGRCIFVNEEWCRMAGRTLEQAQGDGWAEALHPDDRGRVVSGWGEAVAVGQPSTSEFRFLRPDGSVVWLQGNAVQIENGERRTYLGSCINITERKQAELQAAFLQGLTDRLEGLADPDEIMDVTQEALGEYLAADRCYFYEIIQRENLAIVRRDWHRPDLLSTAGHHRLEDFGSKEFLALLARPRSAIRDVMTHPVTRDRTAGYTALAMRGLAASTFSKGGQRVLSLAVSKREPHDWTATEMDLIENVTARIWPVIERARAAHALRENERQLRLVTDHAPIFLTHCDREHRFKFVNRTYATRYNRQVEDIVGRHVSEITGPDAYATFRHHMDECLNGRRVEFEQEIPYATLGRRWVHVIYEPERTAAGEVTGLVAVIVDITARKQVEFELEKARDDALAASRAKDDFFAALSHELRTPLSPVLLMASDAANNPALPREIRDDFETIRANISLEARLIDDLLDLTRIARGKMPLEKHRVDIHAVLRDALANLRVEFAGKRLEVHLVATDAPPEVLGDPVRLQQVLWNLLKNAAKFTAEDGHIRIRTRVPAGHHRIEIEITDDGMGLTASELAHVFAPFTQGEHATQQGAHRFGGLGLGLAISRNLVEMHEGHLTAHSPGRDQGATFTIELPLAPAPGSASPVTPAANAETAAKPVDPNNRVLLVEDHASTRAAVQKLLTRRGLDVAAAGSVAEALALVEQQSFDFVISDVGLPDGDGYELFPQLRARLPGIRGMAMSGYGMEEDLQRSRAAGFSAHLVKPVSIAALEKALAQLGRPATTPPLSPPAP